MEGNMNFNEVPSNNKPKRSFREMLSEGYNPEKENKEPINEENSEKVALIKERARAMSQQAEILLDKYTKIKKSIEGSQDVNDLIELFLNKDLSINKLKEEVRKYSEEIIDIRKIINDEHGNNFEIIENESSGLINLHTELDVNSEKGIMEALESSFSGIEDAIENALRKLFKKIDTKGERKKSYHKLALAYHPDLGSKGQDNSRVTQIINGIYEEFK